MKLDEQKKLLIDYVKYINSRKNNEPLEYDISDSLKKIKEYMATNADFTSVLTFLEVAPNNETREKLVDQYVTEETRKQKNSKKKDKKIRLAYSSANYGFSSVLLLTIIVFILFFVILFFIIN